MRPLNPVEIQVQPGAIGSIVIVGEGFIPTLFDHRVLFGGKVDPSTLFVMAGISHCGYSNGQYFFQVTPERIDIRTHGIDDILSAPLMDSAKLVFSLLNENPSICRVSSVGLNHDSPVNLGDRTTGLDLCRGLFRDGVLSHVTNASLTDMYAQATMKWTVDDINYTIRVEPEVATNGQNVFVAINGSNVITEQNPIESVLGKAESFRKEARSIYDRIRNA